MLVIGCLWKTRSDVKETTWVATLTSRVFLYEKEFENQRTFKIPENYTIQNEKLKRNWWKNLHLMLPQLKEASCLWILLKSVWKRQFFNCEVMFSSLVQRSLDIWKQIFVVRMLVRVVDIFIQVGDSDLVQFMFLFCMTSEIGSFEKLCIAQLALKGTFTGVALLMTRPTKTFSQIVFVINDTTVFTCNGTWELCHTTHKCISRKVFDLVVMV